MYKVITETEAMQRVVPDAKLSFCTNYMMDRGTVYHCLVNEAGHAIVQSKQGWWSTTFFSKDILPDENVDLGKIEAVQISGSLDYGLKVKGMREGKG
jgi:hypothetical protein